MTRIPDSDGNLVTNPQDHDYEHLDKQETFQGGHQFGCRPDVLFSKSNSVFFGCFDPMSIGFCTKINTFWGDVDNASTKNKAPLLMCAAYQGIPTHSS